MTYFFQAQLIVTQEATQQQKLEGVIAANIADAHNKLAAKYTGKVIDVVAIQRVGEVTCP